MTQLHTPLAPTTWLRVSDTDQPALQQLASEHGLQIDPHAPHATRAPSFAALPVNFYVHSYPDDPFEAALPHRSQITLVQGDDQLVTIHSDTSAAHFDQLADEIAQRPASERTSVHVTLALLRTLNEINERTVERIMRQLDRMNTEIHDAIAGQDSQGAPLGVSDMRLLLTRMNDLQGMLSHAQETQFQLLRATYQLRQFTRTTATATPPQLSKQLDRYEVEMTSVKKYAGSGLERMAAMQHSITAMLEVKQHEIVKVFTIITAVFLPPTLIATFYGMNFENMPALATQHGFVITTVVTFIAAVIPLWYIKRKGWLR